MVLINTIDNKQEIGVFIMKWMFIAKIVIFSTLFYVFYSPLCSSYVIADTITIAADNWCPMNCEPESKEPGFMVEIAQSILAKAGHKVVY